MMMVASLKDICYDAVKAYKNTPRAEWVLAWPGMVIICASSVNWTTEVTQSIESKQLKVNLMVQEDFLQAKSQGINQLQIFSETSG